MAGQNDTAYDCGRMNLGSDNRTYEPVTTAFTRQIDSGNSEDPGSLWHLIVNPLTRAPIMSLEMTMSTVRHCVVRLPRAITISALPVRACQSQSMLEYGAGGPLHKPHGLMLYVAAFSQRILGPKMITSPSCIRCMGVYE